MPMKKRPPTLTAPATAATSWAARIADGLERSPGLGEVQLAMARSATDSTPARPPAPEGGHEIRRGLP
jgi:hypothetical protein